MNFVGERFADSNFQELRRETSGMTGREKMTFSILLLTSLNCVCGTFVVNVTHPSYQAEENHNITLEWTFTTEPDSPSGSLFILCRITDGASVLYHVREGFEVSESQDERFSGRVQSDKDAFRDGRIRLHVSRLRTDDSGLYVCYVNTKHGFGSGRCRLNVTAARDWPKPEGTTLTPTTASRGRIGLQLGLGLAAAAVVVLCCLLFIRCLNGKQDCYSETTQGFETVTQAGGSKETL